MRRQIVAARRLSERIADFLARAVNGWLKKWTKRRQWQYDRFVAGCQVCADVFRWFAQRQIDRQRNRIVRYEHQPTPDKDTDDADGNVADKAKARSVHDRAGQQANDEADQQNDENVFA